MGDAEKAFAEGRLGSGLARHDAVEIGFIAGHFFDRNRADAGGGVDIDELFGGGIFAGDQNVAEKHGERFVANEVAGYQHGVSEAERFLLTGVTYLNHVADAAGHIGLIFFAALLEVALEKRRVIEMVLDGIFAFSGDDDDVFDAGGDAFFGDVLDLRLIDYGEHFLGLSFGGGEKPRAQAGGG